MQFLTTQKRVFLLSNCYHNSGGSILGKKKNRKRKKRRLGKQKNQTLHKDQHEQSVELRMRLRATLKFVMLKIFPQIYLNWAKH